MTMQTTRSGATAHPEEMLDFLMARIIEQSGVNLLGDDSLKVTENSPQGMSVLVSLGYAFLKKSDGSKVYPVRVHSAEEEATIGANATGNPRKDAIVLFANLATSPNADATDVLEIAVVEGTAGASPTAPTDGDIETEIGASNPYIRLANVTVASGASSITNANIQDTRPRATRIKRSGNYVEETDGATVTFNVEDARSYVVLGGNRTLAVENYQEGDEFVVKLIQDGTGNRTVTWWSNIDWDGDTEPVLSTDANVADVFGFHVKADGRFEGYLMGAGMPIA